MNLSEHQNLKLNESIDVLEESKRLLIKGSAGVGKTELVKFLLQELQLKNYAKKGKIYC